MRFSFILLLLAIGSSSAWAEQSAVVQCNQYHNSQVEYLRCLDRQIHSLESQITIWENDKLFELEELAKKSGRRDAMLTFKKSIRSFATFADQHCRWQYALLLPDTNAAATKYKECTIELYQHRVKELKKVAKQ